MNTKRPETREAVRKALLEGCTDANKIYWKCLLDNSGLYVTRQGVRLILEEFAHKKLALREEYSQQVIRIRYRPLPSLSSSNLCLENKLCPRSPVANCSVCHEKPAVKTLAGHPVCMDCKGAVYILQGAA